MVPRLILILFELINISPPNPSTALVFITPALRENSPVLILILPPSSSKGLKACKPDDRPIFILLDMRLISAPQIVETPPPIISNSFPNRLISEANNCSRGASPCSDNKFLRYWRSSLISSIFNIDTLLNPNNLRVLLGSEKNSSLLSKDFSISLGLRVFLAFTKVGSNGKLISSANFSIFAADCAAPSRKESSISPESFNIAPINLITPVNCSLLIS